MKGWTLVLIIASLVAGILAGRLLSLPMIWTLLPIALAIGIFIFSILKSKKNPLAPTSTANLIAASLLIAGIGLYGSALSAPSQLHVTEGLFGFEGTVEDYQTTNFGDKLLVNLRVLTDREGHRYKPRNYKALITLKDATNATYGSTITGTAELRPIDAPANYRNDDYTGFLRSKGIFLTGYADGYKCNVLPGHLSVTGWFQNLRNRIERYIESSSLAPDTKGFLISFLLGDKSYISSEERMAFSDAGIAHIFAVSGFHVSLVAMFVLGLLSIFFFGNNKRWRFLFCIPAVWLYILLVGASPATCRAGAMLTIGMAALFLQRKNDPLKALGWAVLLILAFSPTALFDVGFQLSVVCVGSLLLIAQPLNFINHRQHPFLFKIVGVVLVTLTATFAGWLICAFYFHRFSLMFLPLNLLAVPLLPIYILISVFYLISFGIGLDMPQLAGLCDYLFSIFQKAVDYVNSLSAAWENLHPGALSVALWIAGLAAMGLVLQRRKHLCRLWIPASFFALSTAGIFVFGEKLPDGFILQKNNKEASVMIYDRGHESRLIIPEYASVAADISGMKIVSLRNSDLSQATIRQIADADFVMICSGCNSLPAHLKQLGNFKGKIITHPTLHWRYERKILAEARTLNLPIHSLRYDGPYHHFNP